MVFAPFLVDSIFSIISQSLSCKTSPKELQDLAVANPDLTAEADTSKNFLIPVSNTQSPIKIKTIWLEYTNNDAATEKIYSDILREIMATTFRVADKK